MAHLASLGRRLPRIGALLAARDNLAALSGRLESENRSLAEQTDRLETDNRSLAEQVERLQKTVDRCGLWPPGHFYSPHPDLDEVAREREQLFGDRPGVAIGVDVRDDEQLALLEQLAPLSDDQPFAVEPDARHRYHYGNDFFAHGDGLVYHCMLRHLRPNRVVEVGIGFSSALLLDTNDEFLSRSCSATFIDPYPERMLGLLRTDEQPVEIIAEPVQKAPLDLFSSLGPGDILFIDSSHVTKAGSDVNYLYFEVLPCLPSGVFIHVHDIFWPFEYPLEWVLGGRAWNEAYLLHAFLLANNNVEIVWFNDYLRCRHRDLVGDAMRIWNDNPGGSLWLRVR